MLGLSSLNKLQRLLLGIVVLFIVDLIWVSSSELTKYLFKEYDKPFFTTYFKTMMFMLYLMGFLLWRPWRHQCRNVGMVMPKADDTNDQNSDVDKQLGDPIYVPVKDKEKLSGTESDDSTNRTLSRSVRFSNLSEVRQLSDKYAEEASIARLSFSAAQRAEEARLRALSKLSIKQVAKLGFIFCMLWFLANYTYQIALENTEAGIVNVLSSTSGLFTLICAAIFPSTGADRFSLSKLVAVLFSVGGIALVCVSDFEFEMNIPAGAIWALVSAMFYAFYLVSLRRKVDHEDKMDIPMFFGFVGLFNAVIIWPGFFILHYTKEETFEWPDTEQWLMIGVNAVVGTVLSEFLWLWGCFLTSSLIATLSLSLTIPLTMIADTVMKNKQYSSLFYIGVIPVFLSFFAVSLLSHYENWDPVLLGIKKLLHCITRRKFMPRLRDMDVEQTARLIDHNRMES